MFQKQLRKNINIATACSKIESLIAGFKKVFFFILAELDCAKICFTQLLQNSLQNILRFRVWKKQLRDFINRKLS
jgi:hypothetical protein